MKIGEKIRSAREALEMSQDAVSNLIPMNQSSYSKIERDMQAFVCISLLFCLIILFLLQGNMHRNVL